MQQIKWAMVMCIALASNFTTVAQAQTPPPPIAKPSPETPKEKPKTDAVGQKQASEAKLTAKDYEESLAKLKKGDTSIDFVKLRLAYTETKDYSPYGGGEQRAAMFKAVEEKDYKTALQSAEEMLKTNYVDLVAHLIATKAHTELGNTKEADFHTAVFKGLMDAVLINDGKTVKTAMISLGISEQYFVMSYLGFQRQSKDLVRENNSIFDVHTSLNSKTNENRKFYFNIDKVFGRF